MIALAALFAMSATASADLIITEVVDACLAGGNPKFVEVTNTNVTDYTFAEGGIIIQSNANSDRNVDIDLSGVTILAGQSFVIQSEGYDGAMHFENVYGFAPDMVVNTGFSNGDDRYILTDTADGSNLLDIHGEIDVDGSGKDWEYTDGYAYRLPGASANGGVFDISEWFHGGVNSLETGDDVEEAALAASLTTPGVYVPEPATLALLAMGGLVALRRRG